MKTLLEIQHTLQEHKEPLRHRFGLINFAVFGSVVRGDATEESDIDILADTERPISMFELAGAENYLIDLLDMEVDLVLRRSVRAELREKIIEESIPV